MVSHPCYFVFIPSLWPLLYSPEGTSVFFLSIFKSKFPITSLRACAIPSPFLCFTQTWPCRVINGPDPLAGFKLTYLLDMSSSVIQWFTPNPKSMCLIFIYRSLVMFLFIPTWYLITYMSHTFESYRFLSFFLSFIYLLLTTLSLHCFTQVFSTHGEQGHCSWICLRFWASPIAVASLVSEHELSCPEACEIFPVCIGRQVWATGPPGNLHSSCLCVIHLPYQIHHKLLQIYLLKILSLWVSHLS